MRLLIAGLERQGNEECAGALTEEGESLRLVPPVPAAPGWIEQFSLGDIWEVDGRPAAGPSGADDLIVGSCSRIDRERAPEIWIETRSAPRCGAIEVLFDGSARALPSGALYLEDDPGSDPPAAIFWRPDRSLVLERRGRAMRYLYRREGATFSFGFVGLQQPAAEIAAGTLIRVSLTRPWRPAARPEEPLRRFLQLSAWFGPQQELARPREQGDTAALLQAARGELSRVFGYSEFRPLQEAIIGSVLARRDTLAVMPTGSGKSLCYQIPALLLDGLTVVVSPLLALMQDQVEQLRQAGVEAVSLNSMQSPAEYASAARRVRAGEVKLLYVAPETLIRPDLLDLLEDARLKFLAIDEAHCVSEWGHDFRPDYRRLRPIRDRFPEAVCLALTATATARVQNDLCENLNIAADDVYIAGFDRPNLYLEVRHREHGAAQLVTFLQERKNVSGIVYCSKRDQVDSLAEQLKKRGFHALPYHAGLDPEERRKNQKLFIHDSASVMVATIAFGMGINKPDIRFVVHYNLPDCPETYYQQIGRAGRDGLRADCLLLLSRGDVGTIAHFIRAGAEGERAGRSTRLRTMLRYAEASGCRRAVLLRYFDDPPPEGLCGMCDNCLAGAAGRVLTDLTGEARLFLQCVRQTRQQFGVRHLIDVLRGSRSAKVLDRRHDQLPIYGSGRKQSAEAWNRMVDRFIEKELVQVDMEHGSIRLTRAGEAVLAGEKVEVFLPSGKAAAPAMEGEEYDPLLFEALRAKRQQLAEAAGAPPYLIFADRTLREMAARRPRTASEFLEIHGVGQHKASTYGAVFLEVIAAQPGGSGEGGSTPDAARPADTFSPSAGERCHEVCEAFAGGAGLAEVATMFGVKPATVVSHLENGRRAGIEVDVERLVQECETDPAVQAEVLAHFAEKGCGPLGPAHARFQGSVSYLDLRILRLYAWSRRVS